MDQQMNRANSMRTAAAAAGVSFSCADTVLLLDAILASIFVARISLLGLSIIWGLLALILPVRPLYCPPKDLRPRFA